MLDQDAIDIRRVTPRLSLLQHRDPVRAMQLHLVVPFLVMVGLADRLGAFQLVDGATLLIQVEGGLQAPDLLCIVASQLAVELVDHLHHADRLAHLAVARRNVLGLVPEHLIEGPQVAIVVAIGDRQRLEHA